MNPELLRLLVAEAWLVLPRRLVQVGQVAWADSFEEALLDTGDAAEG